MLVFRLMFLLCIWAALAMGCKPEEITDTPQPEPQDTVGAPPRWMPHPAFYGGNKVQWASLVQDENLYTLGNSFFSYLRNGDPVSGMNWNGFPVIRNEPEGFLPFISKEWFVTTAGMDMLVIHPKATGGSVRLFVDLNDLVPGEFRLALSNSSVKRPTGAFLHSAPDSFHLALFLDRNDTLGLMEIKGGFHSSGNPVLRQYRFFPLPEGGSQNAGPDFLVAMGDEVLLSYSAMSILPFSEALLTWSPVSGFSPYFPQLESPSAGIIDAFPSDDQQFAWLLSGNGVFHLFKVYPGQMPRRQWSNVSDMPTTRGKDLGPYIALFMFDRLYLLEKETGKVWQAPNFGLDGHFISDVALYRDTVVISSFTGGIFYQPLSTVWPK